MQQYRKNDLLRENFSAQTFHTRISCITSAHNLKTITYYRYDAIIEMIDNPYFGLYRMKKRFSRINIILICIASGFNVACKRSIMLQ